MIMLAIKAGRKVWEAAESNEASLSLWRPRGGAPTVPCLSWFTAARIAVVKCTHKSGTFNRVIWQTGARRLPEKSFRLFIRRWKRVVMGGNGARNEESGIVRGCWVFLELRNSVGRFQGFDIVSFSFFLIYTLSNIQKLSILRRRDFSSSHDVRIQSSPSQIL